MRAKTLINYKRYGHVTAFILIEVHELMEAYKVIENAGILYLCFTKYSSEEKLLKIG